MEAKEWNDFRDTRCEMIVTPKGRNLFPRFVFRFSGLPPEKPYYVYLDIQRVGNQRWVLKDEPGKIKTRKSFFL